MYYPRKTRSKRQIAFEMYRAGASHNSVVAALGIARGTAISYKTGVQREIAKECNERLIAVNLKIPAGVDYMLCKDLERWLQDSCVPAFMAARNVK